MPRWSEAGPAQGRSLPEHVAASTTVRFLASPQTRRYPPRGKFLTGNGVKKPRLELEVIPDREGACASAGDVDRGPGAVLSYWSRHHDSRSPSARALGLQRRVVDAGDRCGCRLRTHLRSNGEAEEHCCQGGGVTGPGRYQKDATERTETVKNGTAARIRWTTQLASCRPRPARSSWSADGSQPAGRLLAAVERRSHQILAPTRQALSC